MILDIKELIISNSPDWRSIITLDDKVYTLDLRWNERAQAWYVSLYANDLQEVIINSCKLVLFVDLLKYAYNPLRPIGGLMALSENADVITFDNLGVDVQLSYITKAV